MGKNWDNLVVTDQFNVTGRGLVLVVDFIKSGLCSELWEKELPKIDVGDTILYGDRVYTIKVVEVSRNAFNGGLMTKVGLLVI
jgi:hypothetical protein